MTIIPIFLLPLLILIVRTSLTTLIRKMIVSETMTEILIILKRGYYNMEDNTRIVMLLLLSKR